MNLDTHKFGRWIAAQRKSRKMYAKDCAVRADRSPGWWSDIENGRSRRTDGDSSIITRQKCALLAIGLQMDVAEVLTAAGFSLEEQPNPSVAASEMDLILRQLSSEDRQTLYTFAKYLDSKHTLQAEASDDKPWLYQYNMRDHRLYTHDGKPTSKKQMREFLLDVNAYLVQDSVATRREELVADQR